MTSITKCNEMENIIKILNEYYPNEDKYNNELAKELFLLYNVSNPLPTKEEVIEEGDKHIKDWLMGNSFEERTAYRIGFRRSFEYVLRFVNYS